MNYSIREMTRLLEGHLILGDPKSICRRACVDSRTVAPGDLFFALKGEKKDGHEFIYTAFRQGAVGSVVSRLDWLRPSNSGSTSVIQVPDVADALRTMGKKIRAGFAGPVVGITGSNGKTTTKQMLASILRTREPGLYSKGNFNSQIGLPLALSEHQASDRWMVLEMGASEPGNIAALSEIAAPTVGVLTGIGPAHVETFGSLERIARSKWELMEALPGDGCAIVPWGVPVLEPLIRSYTKRLVFFGEDSSCPVRATIVETGEDVRFLLTLGSQSARVVLPVQGRFNVINALAAAAAAWVLGVPIDAIAEGLNRFESAPMRMQRIDHPSGAVLINDAYNANPASMVQSLRALHDSYPNKKKVAVIGAMKELGDDTSKLHFHVGTEIGRLAMETVYLVGPETESVREGAIASGGDPERLVRADEPSALMRSLPLHLNSDTVILFKASRVFRLESLVDSLLKVGHPSRED